VRSRDDDEVDNEYGMVIGSVKGKKSAGSSDMQRGCQDRSSNWSVLSENTRNLVNL